MLTIENVSKTFFRGTPNEKTALRNVNLKLENGDFCTVIGSNGAGKSTLLNAVAGVFPVDEGRIILAGKDITKMPEHRRAALIGRVFQDPMKGTAGNMMIEENLAMAARRGDRPGLSWSRRKRPRNSGRSSPNSVSDSKTASRRTWDCSRGDNARR